MKMKRLVAPLALAGVLVGLPPALAADNAQDFVAKAAQGGMFEVKSSEAIQGKAQDPRINDFAQTMIKDHGAANAKLQTIAGEEKLKVPADVDAAQKSDLDKLSGNAAQVDQDYVAMQQKAHADAVELFESYAKDGDNAQLKSFAAATAPTLRMHRDMIEKIAATMTGGAASDNASTPAANTSDNPQSASLVPGQTASPRRKRRIASRTPASPTSRVSPRTTRASGAARQQRTGRQCLSAWTTKAMSLPQRNEVRKNRNENGYWPVR